MKILIALFALVLMALLGVIIFLISPVLFSWLAGLLGIVLFLLSAVVMVVTFRVAKVVSPLSLAISMFVSVGIALVMAVFGNAGISGFSTFMSAMAGVAVGTGWAMTGSLFVDDTGKIRNQGTAWYLVVWALMLVLMQLLSLAKGSAPGIGTVLLWAGTGLVLGNTGTVLARYFLIRKQE